MLLHVHVNGQDGIEDKFFVDHATGLAGSQTKNKTELMASDTYNCESQYSCNGCHQVRVCSTCPGGKFHQVSLVNCTGLMPYCKEDSGTCTAYTPERCAPLAENFMCMRESGSYPDPTDCTRYHLCKNYTAYSFECYNSKTYNSRTGECDHASSCISFNCTSKNGVKIPYFGDRNVYAYCVHGLLGFIDRCPANYELNEETQNCDPVCRIEGFLADSADSSKYYVCTKKPGSAVLVAETRLCPNGTVIDPIYVHCVASEL